LIVRDKQLPKLNTSQLAGGRLAAVWQAASFLTNGGGVLQPPPSRPSDAAANMSSSRERGLGSVQTKRKERTQCKKSYKK